MSDAFSQYASLRALDERHADVEFIDVAEVSGIWIGIQDQDKKAEWLGDAAVTTGLDLSYIERRASGLLLLGIDGTAYALSFGNGYLLIPDELKDERFGLSFLIRGWIQAKSRNWSGDGPTPAAAQIAPGWPRAHQSGCSG